MKLKFDPTLQYQQDAISAVVKVFEGQPFCSINGNGVSGLADWRTFPDRAMGNSLTLVDEDILKNVRAVQEKNDIEKSRRFRGANFLSKWRPKRRARPMSICAPFLN